MFLTKLSITRPVMTTMGILVFLIFGLLAYMNINLDQMPDVELPYVSIQTIYAGAGPKEVETLITKKIEDAVSTVSEIDYIDSYSLDGVSIVFMAFKLTKDVDVANQEVKDKVDQILNELPDDAEQPIIQKIDIGAEPILNLVLSGNKDPRELFEYADKTIKDRFSQIQGVADVQINGGQERVIRVELDNRVVFENSIPLPQLLSILGAQNMNIPGGYFQINDQEYTVRLDGEFNEIETLEKLQVPTAYGNKQLGQIAHVIDGGKDIRQRTVYFNNIDKFRDENVIQLGIIKSTDGNVVRVSDAVNEKLPEINAILPAGMKLTIISDNADYTRSTVNDTMYNVILGVVFTSIVLLFFLSNIRSTVIVALSMPTSIIATFMLLQAADLTLNVMTLMGLSVSVGVLVANSVVVIENIFRYKELGYDNKEASLKGTSEVVVAVLASTLTNLVVFLPIANISSIMGQFLRNLALSATFATIFSLVFSFTLTPMLASLLLPKTNKKNKISDKFDRMFKSWDEFYRRLLRGALQNVFTNIAIIFSSIVILIASFWFIGSSLGFEFSPTQDNGQIKVDVELPNGVNLNETAKTLNEIENRIKTHSEVEYIITQLGKFDELNSGTNMARMNIYLSDSKERENGILSIIDMFVKELSNIPNARVTVDIASGMGNGQAAIQYYIQGQDLAEIEHIKDELMPKLSKIPGLINLDQSSRKGKPEITITPDRVKMAEAGITTQEMALTIRSAIEGIESSKYREDGEEYDIIVTLDDESVDTPEKVKNIPVVSSSTYITYRLGQLANVEFTDGYTRILHRDKYTTIQITGSVGQGYTQSIIEDQMQAEFAKIDLPPGYQIVPGGTSKMISEMVADMGFAFLLALILTYMLLAAILESFMQPIFILFTIPLAFPGIFSALYLTDTALGITTLMGIIMLIGIVVNNAILMLDYTNQLVREEGRDVTGALIEACPTKLKPILMSTIAIILGMLPMALGIGDAGSEMRMPLGIVSIGGMITSTLFTFFVIPGLYDLFLGRKSKRRNI